MLLLILLPPIYSTVFQVVYGQKDLIVPADSRYGKLVFTLLYEVIALYIRFSLNTSGWQSFKSFSFSSLFCDLFLTLRTAYKICYRSCLIYFGTASSMQLEVGSSGSGVRVRYKLNLPPRLKSRDLFLDGERARVLVLQSQPHPWGVSILLVKSMTI